MPFDSKTYARNYYIQNKWEIIARQSSPFQCSECGTVVQRNGIRKHLRTEKCRILSQTYIDSDL
jgi:predicted RNA-binding Zn-ribbon protein involved in translation (DUF1610 family)